MKKLIVVIAALLLLYNPGGAYAQEPSPVIKALRELVESGKTNFKNDMGAFVRTDETSKLSLYNTKKETVGATTMIVQAQDKQCMYMIRYDVKDMSTDMMVLMMKIVDQYIAELNDMVKTGKYTGKDAKDAEGVDVTEMYDVAGNHILDYKSTPEEQSIYLFGITN